MTIEKFRGTSYFLSNMFELPVGIETELGIVVPTSEHAYQASKFVDPVIHEAVATADNGIASKDLAHRLLAEGETKRPDWEFIKVGVMAGVVREKFLRNPTLAELLIATGSEVLVEGNTWDDRFWGVSPPGSANGENMLGKILMAVREELVIGAGKNWGEL